MKYAIVLDLLERPVPTDVVVLVMLVTSMLDACFRDGQVLPAWNRIIIILNKTSCTRKNSVAGMTSMANNKLIIRMAVSPIFKRGSRSSSPIEGILPMLVNCSLPVDHPRSVSETLTNLAKGNFTNDNDHTQWWRKIQI